VEKLEIKIVDVHVNVELVAARVIRCELLSQLLSIQASLDDVESITAVFFRHAGLVERVDSHGVDGAQLQRQGVEEVLRCRMWSDAFKDRVTEL